MNKKFLVLLLALVLVLSACGDKSGDEKPIEEKNSLDNQEKDEEKKDTNLQTQDEISAEALMNMKESPAEDFKVIGDKSTGLEVIEYVGDDTLVYVPEKINGSAVTSIKGAFSNIDSGVKGIRLGKNIKEIREGSFGNNQALEVFVAEGLEKIEENAFVGDKNLRQVVLNEGLTYIGASALANTGLKEIRLPESLKELEVGALGVYKDGIKIFIKKGSPLKKDLEEYNKEVGYEVIEE